jgi:CRP-like cAMP-binding protein
MDAKKLQQIPLFAQLSKKESEQIARWSDEIDLPAGYHMLDQGRLPHEFMVILDGTAEVTIDGRQVANLGPGDFIGEIAIHEHIRRTATVVATSPVTAMVMLARDFEEMERLMPTVAQQIRDAIAERMPSDDT